MGSHIALPPNPPATKFASQSDAHVRTDAQIKFLYYPDIYIYNNFYHERVLLLNEY